VPGQPPQAPGLPRYGPPPGYPPAYPPAAYPPYGYRPAMPPAPPALSRTGRPLASFADRLLAYLIDMAILLGVVLVLAVPFTLAVVFAILPDALRTAPDGSSYEIDSFDFIVPLLLLEGGLLLLLLGFQYLYYVEYMKRTGQTVGKKAMKIRVVRLDDDGPIDRPIAAKRFLVQVVAGGFLPFFSYVDGLWQLWDKPFQQCLHDKFAKTVVVKVVP
jgi:uncharacterized RDD family membrane protein YckC